MDASIFTVLLGIPYWTIDLLSIQEESFAGKSYADVLASCAGLAQTPSVEELKVIWNFQCHVIFIPFIMFSFHS